MQGPTPHEVELARDDSGVTASILQQLADAVAVMQHTPGIRLRKYHDIRFQHSADSPAEVDAVAAGIGAVPRWNTARTHYEAVRHFGPNVEYAVVYITDQHMDAWNACMKNFRDQQETDRPKLAEAAA
jgi:hypothetical protein